MCAKLIPFHFCYFNFAIFWAFVSPPFRLEKRQSQQQHRTIHVIPWNFMRNTTLTAVRYIHTHIYMLRLCYYCGVFFSSLLFAAKLAWNRNVTRNDNRNNSNKQHMPKQVNETEQQQQKIIKESKMLKNFFLFNDACFLSVWAKVQVTIRNGEYSTWTASAKNESSKKSKWKGNAILF